MEFVVVIDELERSKLRGKRHLHVMPNLFIFGVGLGNAVALKDTLRISIDDEHRQLACIKQDGIRSLRSNSVLG